MVWSAVSRDSLFADDGGRREIGGSTCVGLDKKGFVVFKTGGKTYSSESAHSHESLLTGSSVLVFPASNKNLVLGPLYLE